MKKSIFLLSLFAFCLQLFASWTPPSYVETPSLPGATLRVVGANVRNYFYDFNASNCDCYSAADQQACFNAKTSNMAKVFVYLQADIVALCEIQQDNEILEFLIRAMNDEYGENVYAYVMDNAKYNNPTAGNYGYIKCGYIYRKDKVTKGTWYSTNPNDGSFRNRMIVMCFTEKATKAKFVLSMNHFQAQTSDPSGEKRNEQASTLISALKTTNYGDPDILILGDLNAELGETCIDMLVTAGYADQMYKYDKKAYTYYFKGNTMIDHAMANSTMEKQIVGAYPFHVNTASAPVKFSDHDCYVVGLKLDDISAIEEVEAAPESKAKLIYINGQLYIRQGEHLFDMMGRRVE